MQKRKAAALPTLALLLSPLATRGQVDDQPAMFRATPQHTGVYAGEGSSEFKAIKWEFKTGRRIFCSPAIHAGTAYVGSDDGNLYAADALTGTAKWYFQSNG